MRSFRLACLALLTLTIPAVAAELLPANRPITDVIDHYVDARLAKAGVTPAVQADDYNLVRRLMLDLVGRIPTPRETREYVESTDPHKREQLVDRLMASPEFTRFQAIQFQSMLAGPKSRGDGLREYLTRAIGENRHWDQIFRELLLPNDNDPKTKGASEYLKSRMTDIDRMTIDVSVAFFGVNVSCCPVPRSSACQRLEAGTLLRHEVVLRPQLRQRRLPRRARLRRRQIQAAARPGDDGQDDVLDRNPSGRRTESADQGPGEKPNASDSTSTRRRRRPRRRRRSALGRSSSKSHCNRRNRSFSRGRSSIVCGIAFLVTGWSCRSTRCTARTSRAIRSCSPGWPAT